MESFILYTPPVRASDLEQIHSLLRTADVFVPSFHSQEPELYHVLTYVEQELRFKTTFLLLPDRNLVTRWVGLLNGVKIKDEHRVAAGVLAFAQCANLLIEPNVALYELAAAAGNAAANEELETFRTADNVEARYWVDLALGRSQQLLPPGISPLERPKREQHNLSKPLYRWQRNYILALKIAELHLQGGRSVSRMAKLLHWMYHDFLIGGPAIRLASQYLAPGADRKRLFKGIESPDREKAIAGVRNAAWDLTLLSEWFRHIQRQHAPGSNRPLVILCSLDKHVRTFARSLLNFSAPTGLTDVEYLTWMFGELWGPNTGRRLADLLVAYQDARDNPKRQLHQEVRPGFINEMIADGECAIRNWTPKSHPGNAA